MPNGGCSIPLANVLVNHLSSYFFFVLSFPSSDHKNLGNIGHFTILETHKHLQVKPNSSDFHFEYAPIMLKLAWMHCSHYT